MPAMSTIISAGWSSYNGSEYLVVNTSRTFDDAESDCHDSWGGHLVSVQSDDEEQHIKLLLRRAFPIQ